VVLAESHDKEVAVAGSESVPHDAVKRPGSHADDAQSLLTQMWCAHSPQYLQCREHDLLYDSDGAHVAMLWMRLM
jgi:hypothetical protein